MPSKEPPRRRVPGPARPARPRPASAGARPSRPAASRPAPRPAAKRPGPRPPARRPRTIRLGSPRPRLRLISLGLTLVMLVFVVRLLQVQAVDASAYAAKADKYRFQDHTLSAERGEITDRNGIALAASVDAYDITADPKLFTPEESKVPDAPEQAAALLAPILGKEPAELAKKLRTPKSRYTLLARKQTPQVWNQIKDLRKVYGEKARATGGTGVNLLGGVLSEPSTKRVYPNGELAAGILGYVNAEGKGAGGVESMLDPELAGKDGKVRFTESGGRQVPTAGSQGTPAVPGSDIELTIDRDIQWAAQQAITEQVGKSKANRGYVVVQNTRTGEVLAMANAPGFDPNDLSAANAASMGNAALQDAYEPGSTSKVMSMAAVLEEGKATPQTHVTVPNRLHRGDRLFKDDVDHKTWYLTLNGVLAKSSNIGTILATGRLGATQSESNRVLHSYLRKFGIGSPTGLDFPGETPGILAKPGDWSTSQQYTIPFGQGLSVNAMQSRLRVLDHRQQGRTRRTDPRPRHQGPRRPLHPGPRAQGVPGRQREDGRHPRQDAGVRRRRPGGHRHQGRDPRLPGRGQDRHRQPGRPRTRPLQGVHRLLRGLRPRRRPADHRLLRDPEPHQGQLLRRPDLRPHLQEGHGVRPQDPPRRPHGQRARPTAGRLRTHPVTLREHQ
ncbi:Peptidoglycan D,D-transpeptidase FtsI [Streptomyces narbonensis]